MSQLDEMIVLLKKLRLSGVLNTSARITLP